jgi:hypothetical protein
MTWVSMPRWASADHLQPQGGGLDDDGHVHVVEDLVPLHGPADVLHVVEALEVGTGHPGVGIVEAGGDNKAVVADVSLPLDSNRAGRQVERRDACLVADVDALLDVGLLGGEEQRLEARDLLAVHVGDPARAVRRVLVLGEDDHLTVGLDALERTSRADPSRTAADHDEPRCHRHPLEIRRAKRPLRPGQGVYHRTRTSYFATKCSDDSREAFAD